MPSSGEEVSSTARGSASSRTQDAGLPGAQDLPESMGGGLPPGLQDWPGEGAEHGWAPGEADGSQTYGEIRVTLDQTLANSLREYDEKLLREQEDVLDHQLEAEERSAEREEETDSGSGGGGGFETAGGAYSSGGNGGGPLPGAGELPGGGGGGGGPGPAGPGEALGGIPPGMPDGRDDDIVARQLREAAMTEKDPELREKLWAEYRKYKTGYSGESTGKKEAGKKKDERADNQDRAKEEANDGDADDGESNAGDKS